MPKLEALCIFIKSYQADFNLLRRLIESIHEYNKDDISVIVALPKSELPPWIAKFNESLKLLILTEDLWGDLVEKNTPGYIVQQVIKLNVDRIGLAENYLVLDSDTVFIRPFSKSDFIDEASGKPFLFASEGRETLEPFYRGYLHPRRNHLALIREKLGVSLQVETPWLEAHNSLVLSSTHLKSLRAHLDSGSISGANTYLDLIGLSPYEFNWYVSWIVRQGFDGHVLRAPIFLMWHTGEHFLQAISSGWIMEDISAQFVGVIPNSSWSSASRVRLAKSMIFSLASTIRRVFSPGSLLRWWLRLSR